MRAYLLIITPPDLFSTSPSLFALCSAAHVTATVVPKHFPLCFPLPLYLLCSPVCFSVSVCVVWAWRSISLSPGSWIAAQQTHLPSISSAPLLYVNLSSSPTLCQIIVSTTMVVTCFRPLWHSEFREQFLMLISNLFPCASGSPHICLPACFPTC